MRRVAVNEDFFVAGARIGLHQSGKKASGLLPGEVDFSQRPVKVFRGMLIDIP